jgi:hypothetical protein
LQNSNIDSAGGTGSKMPSGLASVSVASDADVRQFRSSMARVRRAARGVAGESIAQILSGPLAIWHAFNGVRHYGKAVQERDSVSMARQFGCLVSDYFYRIRPDDFYMYQLYLPKNRLARHRRFSFTEIVIMQQHLADAAGSPDYALLRSKAMFAQKCAEHGLPTVPVLAEFAGGEVKPAFPALPNADLFAKPSDLMLGLGAALWRWSKSGAYVHATTGERLSGPDLLRRLSDDSRTAPEYGGSGGLILQEKASNHRSMLQTLTTGGLATIRVVTCRTPQGTLDILPPVIRMPVGDAIADNIAQGGLAAPIDSATGRICGGAIRKDKRFGVSRCVRHPTTDVIFDGFQIPFWPEVLELARRAHEAFPSVHFIGWDIAVLDQGPVLLEGDALWDSDLTALPHQIWMSDTQFIPYYNHHLSVLTRTTRAAAPNQIAAAGRA